jgi:hypothetical protein
VLSERLNEIEDDLADTRKSLAVVAEGLVRLLEDVNDLKREIAQLKEKDQ